MRDLTTSAAVLASPSPTFAWPNKEYPLEDNSGTSGIGDSSRRHYHRRIVTSVLVVDDHAMVRRSIRSLLANETGWELREAENGRIAVDLSQKQRPDIVVLDLVMPVMNGIEAAYEIAKIAPRAKIVFISSHYTPEQTSALTRLFGADFVHKSEVVKELIPTINRLLEV